MELIMTFCIVLAAYIFMTLACKGLYHLITSWGRS